MKKKRAIRPKDPLTRMALKALQEAVDGVIEEHRRDSRPLASWENGKVIWLDPWKTETSKERRKAARARKK